jgi:hypothetical protein
VAPAISSSSSYTIAGARAAGFFFPPGGSPLSLAQTKSNWIGRYPYSYYRCKLVITGWPPL